MLSPKRPALPLPAAPSTGPSTQQALGLTPSPEHQGCAGHLAMPTGRCGGHHGPSPELRWCGGVGRTGRGPSRLSTVLSSCLHSLLAAGAGQQPHGGAPQGTASAHRMNSRLGPCSLPEHRQGSLRHHTNLAKPNRRRCGHHRQLQRGMPPGGSALRREAQRSGSATQRPGSR